MVPFVPAIALRVPEAARAFVTGAKALLTALLALGLLVTGGGCGTLASARVEDPDERRPCSGVQLDAEMLGQGGSRTAARAAVGP